MQSRRKFVKTLGSTALLASTSFVPFNLVAREPAFTKLTILHTNDVHSRIEPFESGKYKGLGGAAKRAGLIQKIRTEVENVLLLDAGDIFQGTPYFNYFGGELEFKLMEQMGYDAATIGNHDFDAGIEGLHQQLPHISFSLLSSNYDFSDTIMNGKTRPYKIFQKKDIRVGVIGIGLELEGLVPKSLYKGTRYLNPIKKANHYARLLKYEEKCDYVIGLSHLGYQYKSNKVSDVALAKDSKNIDLIIGGHTHTFLDQPTVLANLEQQPVLIHQVGWAGVLLGRIDVLFERNSKRKCATCKNLLISSQN